MNERPCLEVVEGELKGARFPLEVDRVVVGSAPECDIPLGAIAGLSRKHIQLDRLDERRWRLTDLGSRNGTLMAGRRVDTAVLEAGAPFSIGKLVLRLSFPGDEDPLDAALPVALEAPGTAVGPAASGEVGPSAAGSGGLPAAAVADDGRLPGKPGDAESIVGAIGSGSGKALLMVALLAGLVGLALYGASWMSHIRQERGPYTRILPIQQERALFTFADYASATVLEKSPGGGDYLRVRDYNGLLAKAMDSAYGRMRQRGYPVLRFLVAQGRSPTRNGAAATVRLKDKSGSTLEDIPVLVVGRSERGDDEDYPSPEEQRARYGQLALEGRTLAADGHRYLAMAKYREAEKLATELQRLDDALACGGAADRLRSELAREAGDLFQKAMDTAFPDRQSGLTRRTLRNIAAAHNQLEAIKRLIPDEESPDWQVVDYWQSFLRRQANSR